MIFSIRTFGNYIMMEVYDDLVSYIENEQYDVWKLYKEDFE